MITTTRDVGGGTAARVHGATPTVFVLDDDASVRAALQRLVEACGWRAETFASVHPFLASPRGAAPSCLVLDVAMPDLDGLDLQRRLAFDRPELPIVFTGGADVPVVVQAMKAGAVEFFTAAWHDEVMVDALEYALERSRFLLERQAKRLALHQSYESLTPREREVMVLVVSGLLNKQVGGELGISEITVKAHRGQVMRKMKASSLPALVHMVADLGLPVATVG